jgi:hypothetical protein
MSFYSGMQGFTGERSFFISFYSPDMVQK